MPNTPFNAGSDAADERSGRDRAAITGLGVVSAIGIDRESFFAGLAAGRCAVAPHPVADDGIPLSAPVDDFGARRLIDARALRRLPRLSQMALVAAREALAQAALEGVYPAERIGVVLGTGLGTVRETMDFVRGFVTSGPDLVSPALFPSSVMNAAAGQMAIELGLRGPNTTINHRDASGIDTLMVAADLLSLGRADALLVGGVDELCPTSILGYRMLARLSGSGVRPYARERDGTVPGEGAVVMLVERESAALRRGVRPLAVLSGAGATGEHRPRIGWGSAWQGAADAIRIALDGARLLPADVDYVCGGGLGLAVDALEARAVASVFERDVPHGSVLGQTGEFMASGALRIAAAIYALERQTLPGTVGAGLPDPMAPVPGLVREPRAATVRSVLVPSLSQGGANSALLLSLP